MGSLVISPKFPAFPFIQQLRKDRRAVALPRHYKSRLLRVA